jgi:hypothetical protein
VTAVDTTSKTTETLRRGDRVRLRSLPEIEASLDAEGRTEALPFMRELLPLLRTTMRVASRADKTCDTLNMAGCSRQMTDTVHLEGVRCDGSAHGGCQAYCLLFFKEQWLERVAEHEPELPKQGPLDVPETALVQRLDDYAHPSPGYYRCQATQLLEATEPLRGNWQHFLRDVTTRNVPIGKFTRGLFWSVVNRYQQISYFHFPEALRFRGGHPLPDVRGTVRDGRFPVGEPLNLQAGELIEVRTLDEIKATLDDDQRNRGLWFDEEMADLCGKRGRVLYRVERLIDEKTGRMLKITKDLYVVAGMVSCQGIYHKLCTRNAIAMMREAWLKRVA